MHNIQIGSIAVAKRATAVCEVGERSVCYEQYRIGNRPGWSFIFQSGRYDGFSPDEVNLILDVTGEVCPDAAGYEFRSVARLCDDFHQGRFATAS